LWELIASTARAFPTSSKRTVLAILHLQCELRSTTRKGTSLAAEPAVRAADEPAARSAEPVRSAERWPDLWAMCSVSGTAAATGGSRRRG
jgi:hypothetical protein